MIIDFHCHVGEDLEDVSLSFEELKKSMDRFGITKAVVFPLNETDNKLIEKSLEILEKSKKEDWIIPFLRFNPLKIKKSELINLLNKGFKGIKLHPRAQEFEIDDPDVFWIYELCEKKNIPILFHTAAKTKYAPPTKIIHLAKLFPNLKIVIAHFFGNDFDIIEEVRKYKNLYVDSSINSGTLRRNLAFYKYGFKNILFASDIPYDSQGVALMKINEAGFKDKDKELILYKNTEKILNL
jgi:predicted TIM-barrel fold metal-dependent hydrolase